jgi:hypothetical protein
VLSVQYIIANWVRFFCTSIFGLISHEIGFVLHYLCPSAWTCFIMFSLCISSIVLYRLFSILLSYIRRRSITLAFEKSFIMVWPSVGSGSSGCGSELWERMDRVNLLRGLGGSGMDSASKVWFWKLEARFSRHERFMARSTNMCSMGVVGFSSASRWVRWRSKSSWVSDFMIVWLVDRPCFREFCEAASLPCGVCGPVDLCAF